MDSAPAKLLRQVIAEKVQGLADTKSAIDDLDASFKEVLDASRGNCRASGEVHTHECVSCNSGMIFFCAPALYSLGAPVFPLNLRAPLFQVTGIREKAKSDYEAEHADYVAAITALNQVRARLRSTCPPRARATVRTPRTSRNAALPRY